MYKNKIINHEHKYAFFFRFIRSDLFYLCGLWRLSSFYIYWNETALQYLLIISIAYAYNVRTSARPQAALTLDRV